MLKTFCQRWSVIRIPLLAFSSIISLLKTYISAGACVLNKFGNFVLREIQDFCDLFHGHTTVDECLCRFSITFFATSLKSIFYAFFSTFFTSHLSGISHLGLKVQLMNQL